MENESYLKELNELKIKYKEKCSEIPRLKAQLSNQSIALSNLSKVQENLTRLENDNQHL